MLSESELKSTLSEFKQNSDTVPPDEELSVLLDAMLYHIGSPDGVLRDELIYSTFGQWIRPGHLSTSHLQKLWSTAVDDRHLVCGLGEVSTDSVLTRSFSVLLIGLLVELHRRSPFLTTQQVFYTKQRVLEYACGERDRRGYLDDRGWAHSAAHTADVIDELAQCSELGPSDLMEMLDVIQQMAAEAGIVYIYDEDERLSVPVVAILRRNLLGKVEWEGWIGRFPDHVFEGMTGMADYQRRINTKRFLRCVYFRIRKHVTPQQIPPELSEAVLNCLERTIHQITRF